MSSPSILVQLYMPIKNRKSNTTYTNGLVNWILVYIFFVCNSGSKSDDGAFDDGVTALDGGVIVEVLSEHSC